MKSTDHIYVAFNGHLVRRSNVQLSYQSYLFNIDLFKHTVLPLIPDEFICPISQLLMLDPVSTTTNQHFDRPYIKEWLYKYGTCPITREIMKEKISFGLNRALKDNSA